VYSDTELASGVVTSLGYSYAKCVDALGVNTFAYCELSNQVSLESRYYFENTITEEDA
jgi:hypothetical protein